MAGDRRYPEVAPYDAGMLPVGDGQQIYWETVGSPDGTPAVWLHGGPGSGCGPGAARKFDPGSYRAVLFDQRGCGRSTPSAALADTNLSTNTTWHLIEDIERLRQHLGIERWLVSGASWGVTLALTYAQQHPERVTALMLAAVTAGTRRETDWITRDMGRIFPREWERFASYVDGGGAESTSYVKDRSIDVASGYARLLADPDASVREAAAREWCRWEDTHVSLMPGWQPRLQYEDPVFRMTFARLVTHYWSHSCFLEDGQVYRDMGRIAHIPAVLVHGRHDISSPLETAWLLHRMWPASRLVVLDDAGHGGESMTGAMVDALDSLRSVA